jgi:hypothetical protein
MRRIATALTLVLCAAANASVGYAQEAPTNQYQVTPFPKGQGDLANYALVVDQKTGDVWIYRDVPGFNNQPGGTAIMYEGKLHQAVHQGMLLLNTVLASRTYIDHEGRRSVAPSSNLSWTAACLCGATRASAPGLLRDARSAWEVAARRVAPSVGAGVGVQLRAGRLPSVIRLPGLAR